ncbi:MAG: Uma2 family endonuclease [Oscillatoriaceae bacterium SKW80]|nr:Uma2 family endonuclease [Oscillatoriaceae bacterium SKYG93]MCX8121825.1 Uma2 family endonuclease [Oscillatoriaceae bacterium SKW80]MDW8454585.1 Uma2 family endonuclease [Oscillatoriaceae cyanobacterium SKYGB_i_bin93]
MQRLRDKIKEYLDNGVCIGWLIDSKNKKVEIYRVSKQEVEVLENPAISGEDVLPGLSLDLTEIWS